MNTFHLCCVALLTLWLVDIGRGDMDYAADPSKLAADEKAALQRELQTAGFYQGPIDGAWGPGSRKAWRKAVYAHILATLTDADRSPVDARSEAAIATLNPAVRPLARALINRARAIGVTMVITSAYRSYDEQNTLFQAHQRGGPQAVAPGHSYHNFALAFDVTDFEGGKPVWESPVYRKVAALAAVLMLTAGEYWTSGQDEPHYEFHPVWSTGMSEGEITAELRRRHEAGIDYLD